MPPGELLRRGQNERAHLQIEQLAEMSRSAYADVRERVLGLRASLAPERGFLDTFQANLDQWQGQSGVEAMLTLGPLTRASLQHTPLAEFAQPTAPDHAGHHPDDLTDREQDVLRLLVEGRPVSKVTIPFLDLVLPKARSRGQNGLAVGLGQRILAHQPHRPRVDPHA